MANNQGLSHDQMKPGDHAWATVDGELVVVMCSPTSYSDYEMCGPWECGCDKSQVELIQRIERPESYERVPLYYKCEEL